MFPLSQSQADLLERTAVRVVQQFDNDLRATHLVITYAHRTEFVRVGRPAHVLKHEEDNMTNMGQGRSRWIPGLKVVLREYIKINYEINIIPRTLHSR